MRCTMELMRSDRTMIDVGSMHKGMSDSGGGLGVDVSKSRIMALQTNDLRKLVRGGGVPRSLSRSYSSSTGLYSKS